MQLLTRGIRAQIRSYTSLMIVFISINLYEQFYGKIKRTQEYSYLDIVLFVGSPEQKFLLIYLIYEMLRTWRQLLFAFKVRGVVHENNTRINHPFTDIQILVDIFADLFVFNLSSGRSVEIINILAIQKA